ncbi:hypothetical protein [Christensenella tenuis]|jgi:hypothetical protein|uniref:Uncharacterized protein n=1 Tax=Christensenella tenuis TaxID=2763033 RepID=A0ABR7EGJ3_9FIRM|nr:hypothetical protein [Christensenella tenuis]MBC5648900.1 hypothetical protein [Christensenella tenuis]
MLACAFMDNRSQTELNPRGKAGTFFTREMRDALLLEIAHLYRRDVREFFVTARSPSSAEFVRLVLLVKKMLAAEDLKTAFITPRNKNTPLAKQLLQLTDRVACVCEEAVAGRSFEVQYHKMLADSAYLIFIGKNRNSKYYRCAYTGGKKIRFFGSVDSSYHMDFRAESTVCSVNHCGSPMRLEHSTCSRQLRYIEECAHSLDIRGTLQPDAYGACEAHIREIYTPVIKALRDRLHCITCLIDLNDPALDGMYWAWNKLNSRAVQAEIDSNTGTSCTPVAAVLRKNADLQFDKLKLALQNACGK